MAAQPVPRVPRLAPLESAIATVAPGWALRRAQARRDYLRTEILTAQAGGYVAARRSRRATQDWRPGGGSANADLLPDLADLRERSRDAARNQPLAAGAINTAVTSVVGSGLRPNAQIDAEVLGLDPDQASAAEHALENEFFLWADSQECDYTRTQSFAELQDTAFRSVLESGDHFVALRFLERPGASLGLKLQLIEGDRVSNPNHRQDGALLESGLRCYGGVEVAATGAPVRYWIRDQHPGDLYGARAASRWVPVRVFDEQSGRRNVLHLFRRLRADQARGVPYLAPALESLKQLSRYSEAEMSAAVVAALFTVAITTEGGSSDPLDLARTAAETGAKRSDDDLRLGNGAILSLSAGESVETINPGRPNTAYEAFVQAILREVGVSLEIPYELLTKHFTSSYSAARAALLEAWKFFRARRRWLVTTLCRPVYESVVTEAVARGRLEAPGFFDDVTIRRAWLAAAWVGDSPGQIDPLREIDAAKARNDLGIETRASITAEITGGDYERVHRQLVKEKRMRDRDGLSVVAPAAGEIEPVPDQQQEA